ncbi:type II toxin-antitoxin system mRNA interferase toxin, RelE/StbE family [Candidatus Roizmanbacteria bacterium]|nr:type II toxin-antitoxin system mRNA interferase toxin, RelE/StbE family [Candidatus Roizmanbacteria bacterium]
MNIQFDPDFIKRLKKLDIRIRKSFKEALVIFTKDPYTPELNNHPLKKEWAGYRSIDVTSDNRAIYKEIKEDEEITAYFVAIGRHEELYK